MLEYYRRASLTRRRTLFLLLLLTFSGTLSLFYFASDVSSSFSSVLSPRPASGNRLSSPSTESQQHTPSSSNILLVSAFFPSPTSKHTQAEYNRSLSQFLSRITTDIYIFTTLDFESQIKEIRGDLPIWIDTTFQSPLEIPPLAEFQDQYHDMRKIRGPAAPAGSAHVYAMRSSKIYFLKRGLYELQGQSSPAYKKYKYAFWTDFDSFPAGHTFRDWPDSFRIEKVWNDGSELSGLAEEDLIFIPLRGLPNPSMSMWWENMGPLDNQFSQSTYFGGMTEAIDWLYEAYFSYHNHWLRHTRFFVGKDEAIYNAIIMLHPSRILGLWLFDPIASKALAILSSLQFSSYSPQMPPPKEMMSTPLGECHDHSMYHIFFLGGDRERNEMARSWLNRWRWMWPWQWIRQLSIKREPCSLTQVLPMQPTLSDRAFNDWSPPASVIYPER